MRVQDLPFNVWLLIPNAPMLQTTRPVRVLDTYDVTGTNFHEDGLFSVTTFGRLGSEERDERFSYIDLRTTIFHPEIYFNVISLKSLYKGILSGKQYAVWDAKEKDFVASNGNDGETGYQFFVKHFAEIEFKRSGSDARNQKIELINKYRDKAFLDKHLVIPAGLRDVATNEKGQATEDEINDLYRKLLMTANTIAAVEESKTSPMLNTARWSLQLAAGQIYIMIKRMVSGKKGWFQGKFGARRTRHGTRNVITAMDTSTYLLGAANAISVTDTEIGLAQTLRGALPHTINALKNSLIGEVFSESANSVWLVNPKTLQRELVDISNDTVDQYSTRPGLEKLINRFFIPELRNRPIRVEKHYLGLIYVDDRYFKVFKDISELPESFSKDNVYPLTLADLLYTSTYQKFKRLAGIITRYPVTGAGSTYPTLYKVRTTVESSIKQPLDDAWQPMGVEFEAPAFPSRDPDIKWMDSLVPHSTRLGGLGADFDGDMVNSPILHSEDAFREIGEYYTKRGAFVGVDGQLLVSADVQTVGLVVANMTGDAID